MANQNLIKIEYDVFKTAKYEDIVFLTYIFQWAPLNSIPRYNYFIDIKTSSEIEQHDNFKKLPEVNQKFIKEQFIKVVQAGKRNNYTYLITNKSNRKKNEFTLQKAIRFFMTPVSIVLENSLNDSYFLNSLFNHFDDNSTITEYLKNGWIHYVNAGGWTNVENYIDGITHSLINFSDNPNKYIRCFVLIDSDRQYEDFDVTSKNDLKLRLEQKGVKFHILNKRAMENYMPDEIITELPNLPFLVANRTKYQKWISAYSYLGDKQKDYLNYQKGFPKEDLTKKNKKRNLQPIQIQELYASTVTEPINPSINVISDIQYEVLDIGLKEFPKFKDEFPKLFQDSRFVHRKSLLKREGGTKDENEFIEIIQKVNSLL